MGAIESKKDGVIKRYQIKVNLQAEIVRQLLALTNWSFADIKTTYDAYSRKGDCPFIDFFNFHKILPFTTEASRHIFTVFAQGQQYINIFELICLLVLTSHNNYRKKLQFLFVLFDFEHTEKLTNREVMLIFESIVNGFCRMTGQNRPKYDYLAKYTIERFIRVNTLEAYDKIVTYRRIIQQVEGNNDCFQLFKRFDQQIYSFFTQESYLFKPSQYRKYDKSEIERIFRILKKVNLDKNYEEVQLVDKNRQFRLENRKVQCIKHLMEEKEDKFKKDTYTLKSRANSMVLSSRKLPTLKAQTQRPSLAKLPPKIDDSKNPTSWSSKNLNKKKVLFLNGKIQSKQDIFETIKYFKTLSGGKTQIKPKEFFVSFEKKQFMKKQIGSLFKYFDMRKKGEINFEDFLQVYYLNITQAEIQLIKQWYHEYKSIHEADHFDIEKINKKEKKNNVELPKATLKRMDEVFDSIDRQKKGYLVLEDLKKAYTTGFTIKQLQDMVRDFGDNNKIFKDGFIRMTLPEDWTIEGTDYVGV